MHGQDPVRSDGRSCERRPWPLLGPHRHLSPCQLRCPRGAL